MRTAPVLRNTRQAGFYIDFVSRTPSGAEVARERYGPLLNLVFPAGGSEFTFRAGSVTFQIHDVPDTGEFRCVAEIPEPAKPRTLEEIAIVKDADGRPVSYLKAIYAA
jgi:hypothetical protein